MDRRVILCLVVATAMLAGGPIAGYAYVFAHMQEAHAAGKLLQLSIAGYLGVAVAWLMGIATLVHLALYVHSRAKVPDLHGYTEAEATAQFTTESAPKATARTPISRWQWGDIEAAALMDDDVKAITERYDLVNDYELVDAAPGATLPDGRWVLDIAINFMYPHGARSAQKRAAGSLTIS